MTRFSPRAPECRVLLKKGAEILHLHILHLHIWTSYTVTSYIFTSEIFTSYICTSYASHLTSEHFTSSHLTLAHLTRSHLTYWHLTSYIWHIWHIFTSSHLHIWHPHIWHLHIWHLLSLSLLSPLSFLSFSLSSANCFLPCFSSLLRLAVAKSDHANATLAHAMRVDCQKLTE